VRFDVRFEAPAAAAAAAAAAAERAAHTFATLGLGLGLGLGLRSGQAHQPTTSSASEASRAGAPSHFTHEHAGTHTPAWDQLPESAHLHAPGGGQRC